MFKQTALITWRPDADAAGRARLEDRLRSAAPADFAYIGAALPASHRGGDLVWHLHFADEAAWRASGAEAALDLIAADPAVAELDAAAYAIERFKVRDPGLSHGVYRTLFIGVDAEAPAAIQTQFADELAGMPDYIPEIVNWAMNTTVASRGQRPWTHVWEQEFATVDGLVGPYMTSAYHWGFVDRWFDHEMPEQIVANDAIRHSASVLETSVMARYGG
jgi:hypothetical protein